MTSPLVTTETTTKTGPETSTGTGSKTTINVNVDTEPEIDSGQEIGTKPPSSLDPSGMSKRVSKLVERLDKGSAALLKASSDDLVSLLRKMSDVMATANTVTDEVRHWYEYHQLGLLGKLETGLTGAAERLTQVATQVTTGGRHQLGAVIGEVASHQRVLAAQLRKAASVYDFGLTLPKKLAALVPAWLAARLPDPIPLESYHLLNRTGREVLRIRVQQFSSRVTSKPTGDVEAYGEQAERVVTRSKLVTPYLNSTYRPGMVGSLLRVLPDAEFTATYLRDFQDRNRALLRRKDATPYWRVVPMSEVDNVAGFYTGKAIYLRTDATTSDCVHEAMHLLSDLLTGQAWEKALGPVMEEAAAEYLCGLICGKEKIPYQLDGYFNNVTLLETIMEHGKISRTMVAEAYLAGKIQPVVDAIVRISGEKGVELLRTSKERQGYDTYYAWVNQFKVWKKKEDDDTVCIVQ